MEISDFLPLIYLSVGLISTYFIGKLLLGHFKEIKKVKRGIEIQREKKSFENGVEDLLDNAPSMYSKVIQELEYLKQNNATPEKISEKAVEIALRSQQILAYETGVANVVDPLGGSWYVESMTDKMESC